MNRDDIGSDAQDDSDASNLIHVEESDNENRINENEIEDQVNLKCMKCCSEYPVDNKEMHFHQEWICDACQLIDHPSSSDEGKSISIENPSKEQPLQSILDTTSKKGKNTSINNTHIDDILLQTISEELQCAICCELLYKPVTAACGHGFCRSCLMRSINRSKSDFPCCPTCRAELCGCASDMCINTTLWNVIQLLYPRACKSRNTLEDAAFSREKSEFRDEIYRRQEQRMMRENSLSDVEEMKFSDEGSEDGNVAFPVVSNDSFEFGEHRISRDFVIDTDDSNTDGRNVMRLGFSIMEFPEFFETHTETSCSIAVLRMEEDEFLDEGFPTLMKENGDDDEFIAQDYYDEVSLQVISEEHGGIVYEMTSNGRNGVVNFPHVSVDGGQDESHHLLLRICAQLRGNGIHRREQGVQRKPYLIHVESSSRLDDSSEEEDEGDDHYEKDSFIASEDEEEDRINVILSSCSSSDEVETDMKTTSEKNGEKNGKKRRLVVIESDGDEDEDNDCIILSTEKVIQGDKNDEKKSYDSPVESRERNSGIQNKSEDFNESNKNLENTPKNDQDIDNIEQVNDSHSSNENSLVRKHHENSKESQLSPSRSKSKQDVTHLDNLDGNNNNNNDNNMNTTTTNNNNNNNNDNNINTTNNNTTTNNNINTTNNNETMDTRTDVKSSHQEAIKNLKIDENQFSDNCQNQNKQYNDVPNENNEYKTSQKKSNLENNLENKRGVDQMLMQNEQIESPSDDLSVKKMRME